MKAVLQPANSPESRKHYEHTIETPVDLTSHEQLISAEDLAALRNAFPGGAAPMWGAVPGKNGANVPKWKGMEVGDEVLFIRDEEVKQQVFWVGTVAHLWRNRNLAKELWGTRSDNGQTWELMFALTDGRAAKLSGEELRRLIGSDDGDNFMGFRVLRDWKADAVLSALGLEDPGTAPQVSKKDFRKLVLAESDVEDKKALAAQRKEQGYLRKQLIPGDRGECALCGRNCLKEMLVAAHIKPRSVCTAEERLDWEAVMMRACRFGCDELYERGYISIDANRNISPADKLKALNSSSPERVYFDHFLKGRKCDGGNSRSDPFFLWHAENKAGV